MCGLVEKTVKSIGVLIIDKLYKQDEFDIDNDIELGYLDACVSIRFYYKGCEIDAKVRYKSGLKAMIEVMLYPQKDSHCLERLEEAVNRYVIQKLRTDILLEIIKEKHKEFCLDYWKSNGFSDAEDYYKRRYTR